MSAAREPVNPTFLGEKPLAEASAPRQDGRSPLALRNLRRADWRVLLPIPPGGFERLTLLGGPEGLGDVLLAIGVARRVSRAISESSAADAVVILHDADVRCEDAAGSLRAGGALYWEVDSGRAPIASIEKRIGRRLASAGLSMTGLYWVRPDFDAGELFVPVHIRTPLNWYLRSMADASSPFLNFLVSRFTGLARLATRTARPVRHCAVTAIAGARLDGHASILSHPAVSPEFRGRDASPLVISQTGADASRRVIVLPFRRGVSQPERVLKFSRFAERNADIEEEQRIAAEIRSRLDPEMQRSIPAPFGTFLWGEVAVGAEAYAGKSLWNHAPFWKRRRIEDLVLTAKWLSEFHRQSGVSRGPFSEAQRQAWVERPLESYHALFGRTPLEEALFERVRERAGSLLGSPIPVVWSHPAFSEFNVCRSGDEISVIDWEGAEVGPPLTDLIYFVTLWYHRFSRERGEEAQVRSFRDLYFAPARDPLAELVWRALDDHMRSLAIDRRFFPMLLALTWVGHALGRVKRVRAFGIPQPEIRRPNLHARLVGLLAENGQRLFAEEAS